MSPTCFISSEESTGAKNDFALRSICFYCLVAGENAAELEAAAENPEAEE